MEPSHQNTSHASQNNEDVDFAWSSPFDEGGEFFEESHPVNQSSVQEPLIMQPESENPQANIPPLQVREESELPGWAISGSKMSAESTATAEMGRPQVLHPFPNHIRSEMPLFYDAPSCNVPFPSPGNRPINVTAVELLVFFPRWIRSIDVINRIMSNGGTGAIMANITDHHRDSHKPIIVEHFRKTIALRMRNQGDQSSTGGYNYSEWSVKTHRAPPNHDPNSLNIVGFRTHYQVDRPVRRPETDWDTSPINFASLARNVKRFPSGYDALSLTSCVQYAVNHPDEKWVFPDHMQRLVEHIYHGAEEALIVQHDHLDNMAFQRWTPVPSSVNQ